MATDARGTSMHGLTSRGLFPKREDIKFLTQMVSWNGPYVRHIVGILAFTLEMLQRTKIHQHILEPIC